MDIFEAIQKNKFKKFKELLDSGVDVNTQDLKGDTSLILCCKLQNRDKYFDLLLKHPDIDINHQNKFGETALHTALVSNHELFKLLLNQSNINVNLYDRNKQTVLFYACTQRDQDHDEIIKLLLENPKLIIDLDVVNYFPEIKYNRKYKYKESINQILDNIQE